MFLTLVYFESHVGASQASSRWYAFRRECTVVRPTGNHVRHGHVCTNETKPFIAVYTVIEWRRASAVLAEHCKNDYYVHDI